MEEAKIALAVTQGVKGAIQDFLAPDIRTIINELKHHTKLLDEHGQKLDKLVEGFSELRAKVELAPTVTKLTNLTEVVIGELLATKGPKEQEIFKSKIKAAGWRISEPL